MQSSTSFLEVVRDEKVPTFVGIATMTQAMKILVLCLLILKRLYADGKCPFTDLERDAEEAGLSGRIALQLGRGLGGKDGLNLWRSVDKDVVLCRENVNICLSRLSPEDFERFCSEVGVTVDDVRTWYEELPTVS